MVYSINDEIVCKILYDEIVLSESLVYEHFQNFNIIGRRNEQYIIYIPNDLFVKGSILVDERDILHHNVSRKFIGSYIHYIFEYNIVRIHKKSDGTCCKKCNEFYAMAEPNQPDGTMICWNCSHYPFYK